MNYTLKFGEILTIAAALLSPLVALQVSEVLQRRRERKQRRLQVFKTLMATRASGLAAEHIQSLNMIDLEFHGTDVKSKAVLNAWKAYLDHLNSSQAEMAVWLSKREDLFVDLLYEMSRHLGYDFDKTHIRRTSYFPIGMGEIEADQVAIRKGFASLLAGKSSLPMFVTGIAPAAPVAEASPVSESPPKTLPGQAGGLPPGVT